MNLQEKKRKKGARLTPINNIHCFGAFHHAILSNREYYLISLFYRALQRTTILYTIDDFKLINLPFQHNGLANALLLKVNVTFHLHKYKLLCTWS